MKFSVWEPLLKAFDGFGGSDYTTVIGTYNLIIIIYFTFPFIAGYCIIESLLLICFQTYNLYCIISFRSLIAIHDILLAIFSLIDWVNQVKLEKNCSFYACMTFIFPISLAINCKILQTFVGFSRKGSPGNPVTVDKIINYG